jgi:gluconolactonase
MARVIAEGLVFPEGPAFDRAGNLYAVELRAGQVSRIAPGGRRDVFARTGGSPEPVAPTGARDVWSASPPRARSR